MSIGGSPSRRRSAEEKSLTTLEERVGTSDGVGERKGSGERGSEKGEPWGRGYCGRKGRKSLGSRRSEDVLDRCGKGWKIDEHVNRVRGVSFLGPQKKNLLLDRFIPVRLREGVG